MNDNVVNTTINKALENLTALCNLSLNGITGVSSVEFIEKATLIEEIDLRGTSVTDLSLLDEKMLNSKLLWIDNISIDVTKIQKLISRSIYLSQGKTNILRKF